MKRLNLAGQRFERLTVIHRLPNAGREVMWRCFCDCGTEAAASTSHLRSGRTRSCGCLHREVRAEVTRTHGLVRTPEYAIWRAMVQRCTNPNNNKFYAYGARGISVCPEWLTFEGWLADVGMRPADPEWWEGKRAYWSIDRIDVDGNYEPSNVRWATPTQQANNKRPRLRAVS